jgi:hypothetical protein
LNSALE